MLMSAYNGQKYIKEQIESILAQTGVDVTLLIRDDGSKDRTAERANEIADNRITYYKEENLGAAKSFLALMKKAQIDYPDIQFFSFADQDDIWDHDKLSSAVEMLKKEDADLYCGSLSAFQEEQGINNFVISSKRYSDVELMVRSSTAGCTMAFNRRVLNRVCEYWPTYIEMHDSWIFRVCQYTGMKIVTDKTPHMKYRIHGENECGAALTKTEQIRTHLQNMFGRDSSMVSNTSNELLKGYSKYIDDSFKKYLYTANRENKASMRRIRLIQYGMHSRFSTGRRKADYCFGVMIGKI